MTREELLKPTGFETSQDMWAPYVLEEVKKIHKIEPIDIMLVDWFSRAGA